MSFCNRHEILKVLSPPTNQEIFTPYKIVSRALDYLPEVLWSYPNYRWCDTSVKSGIFLSDISIRLFKGLSKWEPNEDKRLKHILNNMIYGYTMFHRGALIARKLLYGNSKINGNIVEEIFAKKEKLNMKFDIIVGNPPYQEPPSKERRGGSPKSIWGQFVLNALECLNKGGYLAQIHPPNWRKPKAELWPTLSSKQIEYLEMHNDQDGFSTFGVFTLFDMYVLNNVPCYKESIVIDFDGNKSKVDLRDWPWLPSGNIPLIKKLLSNNSNDRCTIYHSYSEYETRKGWMNKKRINEYKYPVVYTINDKGPVFHFSSRNDLGQGQFGTPKVIVHYGGRQLNPINDFEGEYGMSQFCFGISISSKQEGEQLVKSIKSDVFRSFIRLTKWMKETDYRMFTYFKKNFYKIILEEGNKLIKNKKVAAIAK